MRMREYAGWREVISDYGMPGAIETTYIQASMLCAMVNKLGGTDGGKPLTFADVLPRYGLRRKTFTDAAGNEIPESDPLAGMIGGKRGEEA